MKTSILCAFAGSLVLGLTNFASAQSEDARIAQLEQRIAELEGRNQQNWLNERRAEEVKSLVREVLQDAETRSSLLESGMYAGHDGKHFFLKSADGGFLLNISGQIQARYVLNLRDGQRDQPSADLSNGDDNNESGFEFRRTKIQFSGHIADPRLTYAIQLAVDRSDNVAVADKIVIGYQLTDTIGIEFAEDKGPFTREELTSSKYQLAVERSYVQEFFTLDKVQMIQVKWHDESVADGMIKVAAALSDGLRSGEGSGGSNPFTQSGDVHGDVDGDSSDDTPGVDKSFDGDRSDFAFTARIDVKIMGDWDQMRDFTSWPGEDSALFVGGAIHWEQGETGDNFHNNDFFSWTVDASYEMNGLNLFGAFYMTHTDNESAGVGGTADNDLDPWAFVLQAGYNIPMGDDSIEPFVRYEYLDSDNFYSGSDDGEVSILTFGVNYYLEKHNAKFTFDVMFALDEVPASSSGAGILSDASGEDGQIVIRSQFQLLF